MRSVALLSVAALLLGGLSFVAPEPPSTVRPRAGSAGTNRVSEIGTRDAIVTETLSPEAAWGSALRSVLAICAALLVAMVPLQGAEAARSGGRMGGGTARASRPPPRAAPSTGGGAARMSSGPNISIGIGAPMYSPFGFSPFGGFGLFGPPVLPLPVPVGPSMNDRVIQNQQAQDERKLDEQKLEIQQLQKEIAELKAKKQ
eukprot:TRINITY_DN9234_c0_g1_i1.p2 TRINITY_DN9234_c0_g1~~TRINITY_DN9234_c0_g1_i1.p2  ORF type:complete len:201 (-),score=47.94 TRINITY_DN9234_c0_g1_i1:105-707(-)